MIIALFSDIHANLPAVEAVLADIDSRNPDFIYCLGDLVGYAPWPNEVIREIRRRSIATISGNYDYGIGNNSDDCGCAYKTDQDKENGAVSIAFTNNTITQEERIYLRDLPRHIQIEFDNGQKLIKILLVHGSPRRINEYLFEDRQEKSLLRIMEKADADIMFFGHTHKPYHKKLVYEHQDETLYRHAVNIGSVGKPKDGDPRACYVLLSITNSFDLKDPTSMKVEFVRVSYDIEKAARAVEQSTLPDTYADMLRKAY